MPPAISPRLPPEVWEDVILRLHPSEILRLQLVNRNLFNLIEDSPELQYQLDLYAAGLEDGPRDASFCLPERRKQLEQYLSGWEDLDRAQHSHVSIPENYASYDIISAQGGVVAHARKGPACDIHFVRMPSPSKGITTKQWTLHNLPAQDFSLMMEPELDLLVIIDIEKPHALHFLRMSDGKPHPDAFSPIVTPESLQFYPDDMHCHFLLTQISVKSLLVLCGNETDGWGLILDWRTGERGKPWRCPPFNIGQNPPKLIDDRRILVTLNNKDTNTCSLTLLDTTLISGDTQVPTGVAFELRRGVSCTWDHSSLARVPRQMAPFCLDHSRRKAMVVPVLFPHEGNDDIVKAYVITSDRICALAKKFKGSARVPWEEWKDSLAFVGGLLPNSPDAYCVRGLNLMVDVPPHVISIADPGVTFYVFRCSPKVCHASSGVAGDTGLPFGFMKLSLDDWGDHHSETVAEVAYCEDNVIIHSVTEETRETRLHFLSF